jgi:hypothetical protein
MAIAARVSPQLVLSGVVVRDRLINNRDSGEVVGHGLTVDTVSGPLYVTAWQRTLDDQFIDPPRVASDVAWVVEVQEGQRGSELSYVRELNDDDIERLRTGLKVLSGK